MQLAETFRLYIVQFLCPYIKKNNEQKYLLWFAFRFYAGSVRAIRSWDVGSLTYFFLFCRILVWVIEFNHTHIHIRSNQIQTSSSRAPAATNYL